MAHNVRVKRIPVFSKKDGKLLKGKYTYRVTCKNRNCGHVGDETSDARAQAMRVSHHAEVKAEYRAKNPNDRAHVRANQNRSKYVKKASARG